MATPRFALVAGETSGDRLGAGLIRALRSRFPDAMFEGVTGPRMQAEGCTSLATAEELALFGISEVIAEIPRVLKLRRWLYRHFVAQPPDVFIGIDAPAFNTGLELKLKHAGITTAHYVCPTVWAWREGRTRKIRQAVDRLLAIFPFEPAFFARHGIDARFVGHPLADEAPPHPDAVAAHRALGLDPDTRWVGLLPGSRRSEVKRLGPRFLDTASRLAERLPDVRFVAPMATPAVREIFERVQADHGDAPPVTLIDGRSREVMCAADTLLLASGTATLEALLMQTPMVVAYAVSGSNYALARLLHLIRTDFVSMPNLLAGRALVPELLQGDAEPERMARHLYQLLTSDQVRKAQTDAFAGIREQLALNADERAAEAIAELVEGNA